MAFRYTTIICSPTEYCKSLSSWHTDAQLTLFWATSIGIDWIGFEKLTCGTKIDDWLFGRWSALISHKLKLFLFAPTTSAKLDLSLTTSWVQLLEVHVLYNLTSNKLKPFAYWTTALVNNQRLYMSGLISESDFCTVQNQWHYSI